MNTIFRPQRVNAWFLIIVIALFFVLSGCGYLGFSTLKNSPQSIIKSTKIPPNWQANLPVELNNALPHHGDVKKIAQFWQQFNDALLIELIDAAQLASPNIAAAKTRIAQARAARISQVALTRPSVDASLSSFRSKQQPSLNASETNSNVPVNGVNNGVAGGNSSGGNFSGGFGSGAINNTQIGLQSAWELDLLGTNKILIDSASKTEAAENAGWHDARVSVAAELATSYMRYRYCNALVSVLANDLASRKETARITAIAIKAGFRASADQHLLDASVHDATQQLTAQQAQCDGNVKELVALSGLDEVVLREKLAAQTTAVNSKNNTNTATDNAAIDNMHTFYQIDTVPANVIAQRPDMLMAEAQLIAAAAQLQSRQAAKYPRISLNGSIGWMWLSGVGFSGNGNIWSLGPLSITLPIFDSGKRNAEIDSAQAAYEESAINYRQKVRLAVKEVELALVDLHSFAQRHQALMQAQRDYQLSLKATQEKVSAGFASLLDLEESRRLALQTDINVINLLQQSNQSWIALYRAAGGDWQPIVAN